MTMRTAIKVAMTLLLLLAPLATLAADDHASHRGGAAHEEVVDGVKATFRITSIADEMRGKGLAIPKGLKETHHLAAAFTDIAGKKALVNGLVAIRIQGPGQSGEPRELIAMDGHFGADLDLSRPGQYAIMCRFVLEDGKKRQAMFRYQVK
jgi:hypothetical protein